MKHLYIALSCLLVTACVKPIPPEMAVEVAKACAAIGQKPFINNTVSMTVATCVPVDAK